MVRSFSRTSYKTTLLALIASAGCASTGQDVATQPTVPSSIEYVAAKPVTPKRKESPEAANIDSEMHQIATSVGGVSLVAHEESRSAVQQVAGETVTSAQLTIASIEQIALANNPTIKQVNASVSKVAGLRSQVGLRPNPTVGYQGSQLADRGTDQHLLFFEQEFVRGDKLALNQSVLNEETHVQMWELEAQRFRVLTDVRTRFYEAIAAQHQLAAIKDFVQVARQGVMVAERRKTAGEASQIEVLQAKILLSQVELAVQQTEARYLGAWKDLVAVAGVPNMAPTPLQGELAQSPEAMDWDQQYQRIVSQSPELAAAQRRVAKARAFLCRQEAQPIPNLTLQLAAGYDQSTDNGMLNLQVGAPIPVFNDNSGNISAAYADYCRATHDVKRIEMAIKSRLARAAQDYDAALAAVLKYQTQILPDAQTTLDLSEQSYQAGEIDFLQVLIVRKTFFDSKVLSIQAQGELAQANAKVDGLLLTGGLDATIEDGEDDGLRGQTFGGQ